MVLLGVATVAIPPLREFFALDLPPALVLLASTGIVALCGVLIYLALRSVGWKSIAPDLLRSSLEMLRSGRLTRIIGAQDNKDAAGQGDESVAAQLRLPLDEE